MALEVNDPLPERKMQGNQKAVVRACVCVVQSHCCEPG